MNHQVVERQTALRKIKDLLSDTASAQANEPSSSLLTLSDVSAVLKDILANLDDFITANGSGDSVESLARPLVDLLAMRRRLSTEPRYRPKVAELTFLVDLTDHLWKLWESYEAALAAADPQVARLYGVESQTALDQLEQDFDVYTAKLAAAEPYDRLGNQSLFDATFQALKLNYPDLSLLELEAFGAKQVGNECGVAAELGQGAHYLVLHAIAEVHFDPIRFKETIASAARFCLSSETLKSTAESLGALSALARANRHLYEALVHFEAVLQQERGPNSLFRRIIKLYGELYEDVALTLFAWYNLLAGLKFQEFPRLMTCDASDLAKSLQRSPVVKPFFLGADNSLRHAAHHGNSYEINGEHLRFTLRSYTETVSKAQIIDTIFMFLESLSATSWALSNALSTIGMPVPLSDEDATYMGVSGLRMAELWLRDHAEVLETDKVENNWKFVVSDKAEDVLSWTVSLAMTRGDVDGLQSVTIRTESSQTLPVISLKDVTIYTEAATTDATPNEQLIYMLEFLYALKSGSGTALSPQDIWFGVACCGISLLLAEEPPVRSSSLLRRLLALAESIHDDFSVALVADVFSAFRNRDEQQTRLVSSRLEEIRRSTSPASAPTLKALTVTLPS